LVLHLPSAPQMNMDEHKKYVANMETPEEKNHAKQMQNCKQNNCGCAVF